MEIQKTGPDLGEDTYTDSFVNIVFSRSFVSMSQKGLCVTVSLGSARRVSKTWVLGFQHISSVDLDNYQIQKFETKSNVPCRSTLTHVAFRRTEIRSLSIIREL